MLSTAPAVVALWLAGAAQLGSPKITFDPDPPRYGDLVLVYVENNDPEVTQGSLRAFGYEFRLFRVAQDKLRAVVAVPLALEPGEHVLKIDIGHHTIHAKMNVSAREWDTSTLKVSKEFTTKKSKDLLLRLKEEQRQLQAIWQNEPEPPHFIGAFGRPVDGEVTGLFGTRRIFNGKLNSVHYGLDLEGKIGDPIRAIQGGKVVMSSMRWASGGTTLIDHGGGLFTAYFHMSRRDKKPGEWVNAGDVLGAVGKTGRVTGPHLHLQFFVRARRVDHSVAGKASTLQIDPQKALELKFEGEQRFVMTKAAKPKAPAVGGDDEFGGTEK